MVVDIILAFRKDVMQMLVESRCQGLPVTSQSGGVDGGLLPWPGQNCAENNEVVYAPEGPIWNVKKRGWSCRITALSQTSSLNSSVGVLCFP